MQTRVLLITLTAVFAACLSRAESALDQSDRELTNSIGMKLVLIPKGKFAMGSAPGNPESDGDERQHEVTLTRDYYIGAFEVTQSPVRESDGKESKPVAGPGHRGRWSQSSGGSSLVVRRS